MNYGLKEKIMSLRDQGMSYRKIEKELACSKSTIAYHLGKGQKEKTVARRRKMSKSKPWLKKRDNFLNDKTTGKQQQMKKPMDGSLRKILNRKKVHFSRSGTKAERQSSKTEGLVIMFTNEQLEKKLKADPYCYLTGDPIDLHDSTQYSLDHIMPKARGGDNSLDNCGLATFMANQAKSSMTLEELYTFCEKVLAKRD
mgnify:CR=1 FL=1|tara:strand:+ start:1672 stop:2265 length:594 start_codon:yes stop_codon:yes gene_type:complete